MTQPPNQQPPQYPISYQGPYQHPGQNPGAWPGMPPQKHSGVGIASFVLAIVAVVGELVLITVAAVLVQQGKSQRSPAMMVTGCLLIAGLGVCVVGAILGIVGLFLPNRKKVFAILGLCFNGMILLAVLGLMVIGLMAKK